MKRSYLIQRLNAPTGFINPFSFGGGYKNGGLSDEAMKLFLPIFSFDYMGAAEYEFGRVAQTFSTMAIGHEQFVVKTCQINGKPIYVMCHKDDADEIQQRLTDLYTGEHVGTRDFTYLKTVYDGDENCKTIGWLELDNHWIAFSDREAMEKFATLFDKEIPNGDLS